MKRSDADLVESARSGEVDSLRELYERYYGLAVCFARSHICDRHLAEDVAQEAFAEVCRNLGSLRDGNHFPKWLRTICHRTAIRMARDRWKNRMEPLESVNEPISPAPPADEFKKDVQSAMKRLSVSAREVVHLHYFSGLPYDEIARILKSTPEAVHGRLQRARRFLFDLLSRSDERVH